MISENNIFRKIIRRYFRKWVNFFRTQQVYRNKQYHTGNEVFSPDMVVFFVDGYMVHGGWADRLKGIISTYAICKAKSLEFRIEFNYPFELIDYLIPAHYNWLKNENDIISFSRQNAKIINVHNDLKAISLLNINNSGKQYHVYSNLNLLDKINETFCTNLLWADLFEELFQPTEQLLELIQKSKKKIGESYYAVHFRFQQLLGDFTDPGQKVLPNDKRLELINQCVQSLKVLYQQEQKSILVFSDSVNFLEKVKEIENLYVLDGEIVHMDFTPDKCEHNAHLKTFLDFFMLRDADKIFSAKNEYLRISGFPECAAISKDKKLEILWIN